MVACHLTMIFAGRVKPMVSIWHSALMGRLDEVEEFVEKDPTLLDAKNGRGWTPLTLAAKRGRLVVVRWLLDRGAAIDLQDDEGNTALYLAGRHDHPLVMKLLLERGADPAISVHLDGTPLIFDCACAGGHYEVVQSLPAHPSVAGSINHPSNFGRMALFHASANNHGRIVWLLLQHGADPTFANSYVKKVRDNPRAHPG
jgi:uncharacterized protein